MLDSEKNNRIKRILMIVVASTFLITFSFTTILQIPNVKEKISIYILITLSAFMLIRGFCVDRFYRLIKNQEKVGFWLFWANGFIQMFKNQKSGNYLIIIIPFLKRKDDPIIEDIRKKINIWTFVFYIAAIGFIIYMINLYKQ